MDKDKNNINVYNNYNYESTIVIAKYISDYFFTEKKIKDQIEEKSLT